MPLPSTSIPTSISRTSCIRSITVCRRPSRLGDQRLRGGRVDALGRVDRRVPVLVDPAAAGGEDDRRAGGAVDDQRAERTAAVTDDVDRDRRDPAPRQRRSDDERARVLVVAEAVAEDRDRPAVRGRRAGGQEEVEVEPIRPLDGRRAGERPGRGDHLRRRLVVRRVEGAERDGADAARIQRQEWGPGRGDRERRGGADLPREEDRRDAREREHRAHAARPEQKVRGGRSRGLDLRSHLLELRRHALRREHGRHGDVVETQLAGQSANELGHVVMKVAPERRRLDRRTGRVAHAVRDDEDVGRVLAE